MRSDFPPGGKRVGEWVGMRVLSKVALRNGNSELPAGTAYRVTYARSGLTLESEPCNCCGIKQYIRRVHPRDVEAVPDGVGIPLAKQLPMVPTNHMMNAAVNAWHSWKSRDSGGNVQLLGKLMWEHMADAAPEPGAWDDARGVRVPAPTITEEQRALARELVDFYSVFTKSSHLWRDGRPLHVVTMELLEAVAGVLEHSDHPLRHYDRTCPACNPAGVMVVDQSFVDWLFANCKIVLHLPGFQYPVEHNPHAGKQGRSWIEDHYRRISGVKACETCDGTQQVPARGPVGTWRPCPDCNAGVPGRHGGQAE